MSPDLIGGCACGTVTYTVADAFEYANNCHCTRCRASTGTAFKAFAGIPRERLRLRTGADELFVVGQPGANDTRCARCGSLLFSVVRDGTYVHVALGSLRDDPALRPTAHIMVAFKAPWFDITDELPQYAGHVTS